MRSVGRWGVGITSWWRVFSEVEGNVDLFVEFHTGNTPNESWGPKCGAAVRCIEIVWRAPEKRRDPEEGAENFRMWGCSFAQLSAFAHYR